MKGKKGRKARNFLTFIQHVLLFAAAIALFVVVTGSTVVIDGVSYHLNESDSKKAYEDSELFYELYGQSVADIIRFGVIRSQLETNGKFDGKKIIDVTAYNYRDTGIPEQYVTARYYLEDLLKWQKYGMEFSVEYMTYEELNSFLSDKTMVTIVNPESGYYNTSDANYMKSDIENYTFVDSVSANMLPSDGYDGYDGFDGYYDESEYSEERIEVSVLKNRYKTVDGKNIENYTADLPRYNELCSNVAAAIDSLNYNYEEYIKFKEEYDLSNTNILYCIEKTVDEKTEYYTNMESLISLNELKSQLKGTNMAVFLQNRLSDKLGSNFKYLYYSPSDMIYESNTAIKETTIGSIVRTYDYAYPDNVRIWIGVDTSYPVNDALSQGRSGYQNYLPYFWQWGIFAVAAIAVYLVLFVYLTITTGKETDEDGNTYIELTKFDEVHTEVLIIAFGIFIVCISAWIYFLNEVAFYRYNNYIFRTIYTNNTDTLAVGLGAVVFITDLIFCLLYYSLIRRIKARVLWKNSYLRQLTEKGRDLIHTAHKNGNIIAATWVPYTIFVLFNITMALAININVVGLILAIILDVIVGVFIYHDAKERQNIVKGIERISEGDFSYQVEQSSMHGDNIALAKAVNSIGNGIKNAVEVSMKDERMKTELITNVSHDIKTPLTSIINYVDLIKREETDNERIRDYIKVLDEKSQRLKQLIDDLVEASKISSGNISLNFEKINLTELLNQTIGEFSEKFEEKGLSIIMGGNASNVMIEADSRSIWRVMENLFNNVYKYALERTRVYVSLNLITKDGEQLSEQIEIIIRNISATELNCNPEELTERFIRGDASRTTEGNGLGLSIAKNLTEAQHGKFEIQLDGDLFKVILTFPVMKPI